MEQFLNVEELYRVDSFDLLYGPNIVPITLVLNLLIVVIVLSSLDQ